jgi:hypothetical protein
MLTGTGLIGQGAPTTYSLAIPLRCFLSRSHCFGPVFSCRIYSQLSVEYISCLLLPEAVYIFVVVYFSSSDSEVARVPMGRRTCYVLESLEIAT